MSHDKIELPKDMIMCCAVGASGQTRVHTELTFKWIVDKYSKYRTSDIPYKSYSE